MPTLRAVDVSWCPVHCQTSQTFLVTRRSRETLAGLTWRSRIRPCRKSLTRAAQKGARREPICRLRQKRSLTCHSAEFFELSPGTRGEVSRATSIQARTELPNARNYPESIPLRAECVTAGLSHLGLFKKHPLRTEKSERRVLVSMKPPNATSNRHTSEPNRDAIKRGSSRFWGQMTWKAWDSRWIISAEMNRQAKLAVENKASGKNADRWKPKLERTALDVLMAVAARADYETHDCFPGYGTIAADTGLGLATVRRQIAELERIKLLLVSFRTKKYYRLNIRLIEKCAKVVDMMHLTPWPRMKSAGELQSEYERYLNMHQKILNRVLAVIWQDDHGDFEGDHFDHMRHHDDRDGDHGDHRSLYTEDSTPEYCTAKAVQSEVCVAEASSDLQISDDSDGSSPSRIQTGGLRAGVQAFADASSSELAYTLPRRVTAPAPKAKQEKTEQPAIQRDRRTGSAIRVPSKTNLNRSIVQQVEEIVDDLIRTHQIESADRVTRFKVIIGLLKQAVQANDLARVLEAVLVSRRPGSGFDWTRRFKKEFYTATIDQLMHLCDGESRPERDTTQPQPEIGWITAALR